MRLEDLLENLSVTVHFFLPGEIGLDLDSPGIAIGKGSLANNNAEKDLFLVIASAMNFPDYFGNNWDALDECLGNLEWLPADTYFLVLRDARKGWSQDPYVLGRFVTTWLEASAYWIENKKPFHLIFIM